MNVMFCDRCGQEIASDAWYSTVVMRTSAQVVGETFLSGGEQRWDLCNSCADAVYEAEDVDYQDWLSTQ